MGAHPRPPVAFPSPLLSNCTILGWAVSPEWPKWPEPAEDTSGASGCMRASRSTDALVHAPRPMSAVRSQVGVLHSPRSSSEKKDPGLRVFSGYSCVPIFIHTSLPALRCQTTCAAPPRDRHVATKLSLALATKAISSKSITALLLRFCVSIIGLDFSFLFALREGGHALREEEMAFSCFAFPSTHTCPA